VENEGGKYDMKKLSVLFLFLILISLVSAGDLLQSIKQTRTIDLIQTCSDCTFVELTSITYPNGTKLQMNVNMTQIGEDYSYPFGNTTQLGIYKYNTCGDLLSPASNTRVLTCETISFEVTPSGWSGGANVAFFIFIIVAIYSINLLGFFGKNIPMTILGGMALMFLGIYMIQQGIVIYRDNLTNYFSYITIAWGFISAIWAGLEQLEIL